MSRLAKIKAAETLDELWALIPETEGCDGYCASSCGPIAYTPEEARRIAETGYVIPNRNDDIKRLRLPVSPKDARWCPALTADKKCAIYDQRPTICRAWGSAKPMLCLGPNCHVAQPLSVEEGMTVIWKSHQLGGDPWPEPPDGMLADIPRYMHKAMWGLPVLGKE